MQRAGALEQGEVTVAAAGAIANSQGNRDPVTPRVDFAARAGVGLGFQLGVKAWPAQETWETWGVAADVKWAFLDGGPWEASIAVGYGVEQGSDGPDLPYWEGRAWSFPLLVGRNLGPHQAIAGIRVMYVRYGSTQHGWGQTFVADDQFVSPGVVLGFDARLTRFVHVLGEFDLQLDTPAGWFHAYLGLGLVVHLGAVPN